MVEKPRALLFDFDGVLADTEPIHLKFFQKALKGMKIDLSHEDYYAKYLGLDDRACFEAVFKDHRRSTSDREMQRLMQEKNKSLLKFVAGRNLLLPGVTDLLKRLTGRFYLAVVSGALRSEVTGILKGGGVLAFQVIVTAEDVTHGKPAPDGFLEAVRRLNRDFVPTSEILLPSECLVIEDSPWGLEAAAKAGMKSVAVATSYPKEALKGDWVIEEIRKLEEII